MILSGHGETIKRNPALLVRGVCILCAGGCLSEDALLTCILVHSLRVLVHTLSIVAHSRLHPVNDGQDANTNAILATPSARCGWYVVGTQVALRIQCAFTRIPSECV